MPFIPNTPEAHAALVNPSAPAVCRGVTNDGKPCKRELVRNTSGQPQSGIITIINKQQAYFCNKHQDQAQDVVLRHTTSFARRRALVGRGSMDTLIEQVEMLVGGDGKDAQTVSTTVVSTTRKVPRDKDPFRPLPAEEDEEDSVGGTPKPPSPPNGYAQKPQRQKKRPGFIKRLLMGCCCVADDDPDDEKNWSEKRREAELRSAAAAVVDGASPIQWSQARKTNGGKNAHVAFKSAPPTPPLPLMHPQRKAPASAMVKSSPVPKVYRIPKSTVAGGMGPSPVTPQSRTGEDDIEDYTAPPIDTQNLTKEQKKLLKLIPKSVTGKGLSRLQEELLKPFSPKDEAGYIYMFWLTDSPLSPYSTPTTSTNGKNASSSQSLLRPRQQNLHPNTERLRRATVNAVATPDGTAPKLLFKIGRANNVQRRLHEWTAQCGYNLSLIRYYPHTSGASTSSAASSVQIARKVPNSHRIERLIHLELSATPGANPEKKCDACGKTHKEWFEVEASREGILAVDEVIKRWVTYGERSAPVVGMSSAAAVSTAEKTRAPRLTTQHQQRPDAPAIHNTSRVKMYEVKKKHISVSKPVNPKSSSSSNPKPRAKAKASSTSTSKTKKKGRVLKDGDDAYEEDEDDIEEVDDEDWGEKSYSP